MISSSSCFCLLFGASPWGLHGMVCLSVPGELWVTRNFSFNGTGFRSQLLSHFYMNKLRTRHRSKRPRFWSQLLLTVWMILHKFNHHIKKKKKKRKAGERCRLCFLQVPSSLVSLWRQVEWPEFQPLNSREAERQAAVETLHASQTTSYKSTAYTCLSGKWAEKGIHFRKSNCVKELIPEKSLGLIVHWEGLSPVTNNPAEKICTSTTQLHWLTTSSQMAHGPPWCLERCKCCETISQWTQMEVQC